MRKARGVVLLLIALQATLLAQRLSDSDVERAIKAGQEGKFSDLVSDCIGVGLGWHLCGARQDARLNNEITGFPAQDDLPVIAVIVGRDAQHLQSAF